MNTKDLNQLFQRDLSKLIKELKAYSDERNLWRIDQGINNSAGNFTSLDWQREAVFWIGFGWHRV